MPTMIDPQDPKPGIYFGVPDETYWRIPAMSSTAIRAAKRGRTISMAHLHAARTQPREPTAAMKLGSLVDAVVLGVDRHQFAVAPKIDKRTTIGKAEWAAFCADNADKTIVDVSDMAVAQAMRASLNQHRSARALLNVPGEAQAVAVWYHSSGLLAKARIDRYIPGVMALDLKTAVNADPWGFARSVERYGYHNQIAWYMEGFSVAAGIDTPFTLVVVEKEPPYAVGVYTLPVDALVAAQTTNRMIVDMYARCQEKGEYPAYWPESVLLELQPWASIVDAPYEMDAEHDDDHAF